jgi:predicted small lipoprotein YifL
MRFSNLLFALVFFIAGCGTIFSVAGCGTKGGLYLPDGEIGEVAPVSIRDEGFQPETPQQELQNRETGQEEDENEGVYEDVDVIEDEYE